MQVRPRRDPRTPRRPSSTAPAHHRCSRVGTVVVPSRGPPRILPRTSRAPVGSSSGTECSPDVAPGSSVCHVPSASCSSTHDPTSPCVTMPRRPGAAPMTTRAGTPSRDAPSAVTAEYWNGVAVRSGQPRSRSPRSTGAWSDVPGKRVAPWSPEVAREQQHALRRARARRGRTARGTGRGTRRRAGADRRSRPHRGRRREAVVERHRGEGVVVTWVDPADHDRARGRLVVADVLELGAAVELLEVEAGELAEHRQPVGGVAGAHPDVHLDHLRPSWAPTSLTER